MPRRNVPSIENIKDPIIREAVRLVWDKIEILTKQTLALSSGTLFPDDRPSLTGQDTGTLFYSTDYNRLFRWNGTSWEDAPGQPSRNEVSFFFQTPNPQSGWALCDGGVVRRSLADGTVESVTTPTMVPYGGLKAWIRL